MTELYENTNFRFIKVRAKDKRPVELNWQKFANYSFNDVDLQNWLKAGNNVGLVTGFGDLLVVDFDDKDFQDKYEDLLPKTLTQQSGSGGHHLIYKTDNPESLKILDENKRTLADIQGEGKQIIVAPSIHPNGQAYKFVNDEPIAFLPIAQLKALFAKYLKEDTYTGSGYSKDLKKPNLRSVLSEYGVNTATNLTACPWHSSKGGKCFSFDDGKGVWKCFHCDKGGDVISFIEEECNTDFKGACEILDIPLEKPVAIEKIGKPRVCMTPELKANPILLGKMIGEELGKKPNLFYRPYFDELVEITIIRSKEEMEQNRSRIRTNVVDSDRLVNLIQERFSFYIVKESSKKREEIATSISKQQAALLLKNDSLLDGIKILEKVLTRPYMYANKTGLHVEYNGYSEKTNNFYTPDTPEIQEVTVEDAKKEIEKILTGFCFEDESDKAIAISYLITPALRGLYVDKRERTPCFALIANRERAGKDYLAGIRSLIYSGVQIDHPPLADGERANVDEWRKKFTSMLMNGETIFHSANNVGYLNNPVFEALITSKVMQDRLLGSNNQKSFDNWLDISFSANLGLKWRGDMSGRLRKINLFYAEEDPNSRTFPIPDLHGYVSENRGYVLSCIYALIQDWYTKGMPKQEGKVFSSFPVWAKHCGAIMDHHELGDPLIYQEDDEIGGNQEEGVMSAVFELMVRWQCNENKMEVKSSDILKAITDYQNIEDGSYSMHGLDELDEDTLRNISIDNQSGKVKMGILISKFKGRIMKGIHFKMVQSNKIAKRRIYSFDPVGDK